MLFYSKIILMLGLSSYLTIAVCNNFLDKGTNTFLLEQMLGMSLLKSDPLLGNGLLHRHINNPKFSIILLRIIAIVQLCIALNLWVSTGYMIDALFNAEKTPLAIQYATFSLTAFMSLWFFFWCGGLWFGYWIKTGQIQEVHMKLILLSLLSIIFIQFGM